jgi:hypothetical protein
MTGVDPAFLRFVAYREHERAKVLARPARRSVADYYRLLLILGLKFEPLARSLARVVEPRRPLGDYALFMGSLLAHSNAFSVIGHSAATISAGSWTVT